jgi:A/G-specific adenine glycosylase
VRSSQRDPAPTEVETAREVGARLERWFAANDRRFDWRQWTDAYRLTVIEVLLQRTRADTVARFAPGFFKRFPSWQSLAEAGESTLIKALAPIGLNRRRADVLKRLSEAAIARGEFPSLGYPGVGQYVDRALRVVAHGEVEAMVDGNFVRLIRRVFVGPWMAEYRKDRRLQALALAVVRGSSDPRTVNWAVLDHGALSCTPREPRCQACPLANLCNYYQQATRAA